MCRPIQDGGSGIRRIKIHNKVLLGKWLWRFSKERESLWRRVIVARYGLLFEWNRKDVRNGYGTGNWKSILKGKFDFWKFIRFKLGSGKVIRFWEDLWGGELPLRYEFRSIYNLALNQEGSVVDNFDVINGGGWIPRLRRNLND